ncbi:LysR family transcriptional regulator [Candidimonas nitroreducens]|nr:LysR family transcriptional regulator [Candidimonas nitroreducens]
MNLRQLEVFYAIMRTGSVTSAARMLHVSQPAVSTVLKHFESRLGIKLFERVAGRLTPTPEAQAILPEVRSIFGRVNRLGQSLQDLIGGRIGRLAVAGSSPIANGYLAQGLASFVKARPDVQALLYSMTSRQVVESVINRESDVGVAYGPVLNSAVRTDVLTNDAVMCAMREDCPLAAREKVRIEDLASYPLITYLPQAGLRSGIDSAFEHAGVSPHIAFQVVLALSAAMLAYHGAGIALVLPVDVPIDGLVWRPLEPHIEVNMVIITARDSTLSRTASAFVEHLKNSSS